MSENDKIIINDLELDVQIGLTKKERAKTQRIVLCMEIFLDLSKAAKSKKIKDTICYSNLTKLISDLLCNKDWILLEELGESVCNEVIARYEIISNVTLLAKKYVLKDAAWVGVKMNRNGKKTWS